jgi:hypothetical protein
LKSGLSGAGKFPSKRHPSRRHFPSYK